MSNKVASLEKHKAFLDTLYANRTAWSKDRKPDAKPSAMVAWANTNFPDREARGLRFCDLKHLDLPAYHKVQNWRRDKNKYPGDTLPDLIGFPTKRAVNDRLIAAGQVPTSAEVNQALLRGEPDAINKMRDRAVLYKRLQKQRKQAEQPVSALLVSH